MANLLDIDNIELFSHLGKSQKEEILKFSKVVNFPKSTILIKENDKLDDLLFLQSGLLKVYKIDKFYREIFLYHIYPGEIISEPSSLLSNQISCYSNAEFIEEGQVLAINYQFFKKNYLDNHILSIEFLEEIIKKTNKLQFAINRELVFDSTAKVAYLLCNDLAIFNKTKRGEISFILHMQPATLSRVLGKFKQNRLIEIKEDGTVIILQQNGLEEIYQREKFV